MLQFFAKRLRNDRGFTLIELLIVVAIIAILAAILIPNFLRARAQSQVSASKGNMKNIATALESYFVDKGSYPAGLGDLGPDYLRSTPTDPCANVSYGYTAVGTAPNITSYSLTTNWSTTVAAACYAANNNQKLLYTPEQGLQSTP